MVMVLVATGDQTGAVRFVQASTASEAFVAHEILKPKLLVCTPKAGGRFKIVGVGRNQNAV